MINQPNPKGVYAITPDLSEAWGKEAVIECVEAALSAGVKWVQCRQKNLPPARFVDFAAQLGALVQKYDAYMVLNDARPDYPVAELPAFAGVHLGKDDLPIHEAKALWGDEVCLGASCYNQFDRAEQAIAAGATYVAFGAMHASTTKPNAVIASPTLLTLAKQQLAVPCTAIGGIELSHAQTLIDAGADSIALVSALFGKQPDPEYTFAQAEAWVEAMK